MTMKFEYDMGAVAPFSFELTVNKPRYGYVFTPFERYSSSKKTLWTGVTLDEADLGLKLTSVGTTANPLISVSTYSEIDLSDREEERVLEFVKSHLQLSLNISDFYDLAEEHPIVRQATKDLYGMRNTHFPDLFNAAIVAITLQMTKWDRSLQMINLLYKEYGKGLSFNNNQIIITPSPARVLKASEENLKKKCGVGYRAKYVLNMAKIISSGFSTMQELKRMSASAAKSKLMEISGIGEYSADIITPHPSFPVDTWSAKIFRCLFNIPEEEPRRLAQAIKEFAQTRFDKWQGYVYAYLLHDLDNVLNFCMRARSTPQSKQQ
jgi:3-methyladenine DNA glycosylase/8-oxoguanine DNA glycosylase